MKIIPTKVTLSYDNEVKVGKHVIGWWHKNYVAGSMHYRPSIYEGKLYYTATIYKGTIVNAFSQKELREEIIAACKDGVEPYIEKIQISNVKNDE